MGNLEPVPKMSSFMENLVETQVVTGGIFYKKRLCCPRQHSLFLTSCKVLLSQLLGTEPAEFIQFILLVNNHSRFLPTLPGSPVGEVQRWVQKSLRRGLELKLGLSSWCRLQMDAE